MDFAPEFWVILTASTPILELRGAIPLGVLFFDMYPFKAYILAVLGNMLPVIPLLFFFNYVSAFLMRRFYFMNRFLTWVFEYTRRRHDSHFHHWRWAELALFVFVALPLPMTGAWSGSAAAFVFGMPLRRAAIIIFLGVLSAGGLVILATFLGLSVFTKI